MAPAQAVPALPLSSVHLDAAVVSEGWVVGLAGGVGCLGGRASNGRSAPLFFGGCRYAESSKSLWRLDPAPCMDQPKDGETCGPVHGEQPVKQPCRPGHQQRMVCHELWRRRFPFAVSARCPFVPELSHRQWRVSVSGEPSWSTLTTS